MKFITNVDMAQSPTSNVCYKTTNPEKMNPSFQMITGQNAVLSMIRTQGNPHIYHEIWHWKMR